MLGRVVRRASFQRSWYWRLLTSSVFFTGTVVVWDCAHAQLVTDTTLGNESSTVTPNVIINGIVSDLIDGGAIRGINLFHSFSEFNVGEGRGVYFNNPTGTENILSRVTGNNPSNILGTLGVTGGNANLFLINPKGIIFGTNASLDVRGSFVATTANGIQFDNLGIFSATNPEAPSSLLTINPKALLFNQINPNAAIQNNSIAPAGIDPAGFNALGLRVPDGRSLLLVGGNVNMDGGKLNAYGGRVELGGLAEPGNIALSINGDSQSLRFPDNVARTDVLLINQAAINVKGTGSGNIAINAQNLEILKESVLSAGIGQGLGTPETVAGDITLNATGEIKVAGMSRIANFVFPGAKGNGGNITIDTGSLSLPDDAQLSTSTLGQGNAGNVIVRAKGAVSLVEGDIFSTVEAGGVGKGGNIDINAASLSLIDSGGLLTFTREASDTQTAGQGDAGNVNVKVTGEVDIAEEKNNFSSGIRSLVATGTVGNGGNITIDSGSFSLRDGARLNASTRGQGNAGNIDINVTGALTISGNKDESETAIFTDVETGAKGNGGNITIDSGSFSLRGRAQLTASTSGQGNAGNVTVRAKDAVSLVTGTILSTVQAGGVGKGGNIDINAASLSLTDGAQLQTITFGASATQPAGIGDAGNVNLKVTSSVDIAGEKNSFLSAIGSLVDTGAVGNGGNITIDSDSLSLRDGARLVASTFGQGNAGNIDINVTGAMPVSSVKDESETAIFTSVETGAKGNGGNITLKTGSLAVRNGAVLTASTSGQGNAGNVIINADRGITLDGSSGVLSNVEAEAVGNGGNISINASELSLTNGAQLGTIVRGALGNLSPGRGNAGSVNIDVRNGVEIAGVNNRFNSGIFSFVQNGAVGNGGNITLKAGSVTVKNGAQIEASTFGQGNAGNVNVKVTGVVDIAREKYGFLSGIFSAVGTGAKGNGGNITINSDSFFLKDSAQLEASTYGQGNAGNVTVQAKDAVFLTANAYILSTVEAGGVGNGGNIDINAATLTLRDGSQLLTFTREAVDTRLAGRGNAGNINVNVTGIVDMFGEKNGFTSAIASAVLTGTEGKAGNITINSSSFSLRDGAFLDARTRNDSQGGNITVNTGIFEALNGGQLITTTSSNGSAGTIALNATEKVIISGSDPNYNNRRTQFSDRIVINVGANSGFFVSSSGSGITGDIEINSPKITLDNQGKLNAESASGNGGNINLNSNLLLLRRGAQISTTAGTAEKGGDGGNISINSKFIVAVPNENSDIIANAFTGRGGNINIRSQAILGIEARPKQSDITNDITASSNFGSSGIVDVVSPDNSSIQNNLAELSQTPIDTNALIANSCIVRTDSQEGTFIITGSDGFPYRPGDVSVSTYPTGEVRNVQSENVSRPWQKGDPIVEASGVYQLASGQLVLSRKCSQ